ncbi:MAG: 3-methyl-2-oxobutanoate hydroxymethyltransferase [Chlorobia bacterium]|nr:3-methyl-2-oxobutanoate hydroxymethyltransferase [Fimbriimonadaceae bacterium]
MGENITAPKIRAMKASGEKIVCLTAYDAYFGKLADNAGVDLILVGDSVANVVLGYPNTVPVTMDEMLHHVRAVHRGVRRSLLVADMPFGSYNASVEQAVENAVSLAKAGAESVKLEGDYSEAIAAIVKTGIPVMGHVGMTPQSVNNFGGFRVQGRGEAGKDVVSKAKSIQDAGAYAIVLELIPADLAAQITAELSIPTIGIGAGQQCDGQIQVLHDILGLSSETFKHAKRFAEAENLLGKAIRDYSCEVRNESFPTVENSF